MHGLSGTSGFSHRSLLQLPFAPGQRAPTLKSRLTLVDSPKLEPNGKSFSQQVVSFGRGVVRARFAKAPDALQDSEAFSGRLSQCTGVTWHPEGVTDGVAWVACTTHV